MREGPVPPSEGVGKLNQQIIKQFFSELARSNNTSHKSIGRLHSPFSSDISVTSNYSRQTSDVCRELKKAHPRLLGIGRYTRVQNSQAHSAGDS